MARVKGPLFSLEASGTVSDIITFSQWKGRNYVRQHVIPFNPRTPAQVNVRTAMTLLVTSWQGQNQTSVDAWNEFGKQFNLSGFNSFVSRGMDAYIIQLTSAVTPASVGITGVPPTETWTWA